MPLPEASEQEGERMRAGQEPSPVASTDVVPAAPSKAQDSCRLVLLMASDQGGHGAGSDGPGLPGASPLTSTFQKILPPEEQEAVQPSPRAPEQRRGPLDPAPTPLEFLRTPFGGRLLVHESFLYKQEKAVGDKVYWKCRQHVELGCRGRAITRGARATAMRGHCHPPDEEGLEARRQRQKPPGRPESPGGQGTAGEPPEGLGPEGLGPWLGPEEPGPGLALSRPATQDEGPRAPSLLSLPPKKRPTLGIDWPRTR